MRNHVINEITKLAESDARIMIVTGDLGFGVLEEFRDKFPDRYLNAGISEQNMTSVAAGLALEGNLVFTYSIGNFPTLRCIEQIRNDVCYHNANVKILAVGGGFPYGDLGMTHHATEDIAMMRALPNMRVYAPADAIEAVACLKEAYSFEGPAYIRMARGKEPNQHKESEQININRLLDVKGHGNNVTVLTTGTILSEGVKLIDILEGNKINAHVYSCPCVKPLDREGVISLSRKSSLLVTMEDHNIMGGFGGAVAEYISEIKGPHSPLIRIGLPDTYTSIVGEQNYLRDYYGISAAKAAEKIRHILGEQ